MQNIEILADLAFQYGSFLFALLFAIYLPKRAYEFYKTMSYSPKVAQIHLWIYISTCIIGVILVIVISIIWWSIQSAYAQTERDDNLIQVLQSERTDVGRKIDALQKLSKRNVEELNEFLKQDTNTEPMLLTVLDLSRHSDAQLASDSEDLLVRFGLISYISEEFLANSHQCSEIIIQLLSRFDSNSRDSLLSHVHAEGLERCQEDIQSRVIIPTGSSQGDRYYVKALWDSDNSQDCLTELFNRELITDRSLEEEEQLMEKLDGRRYVYWYSKDWALYISEKIEECRGEAAFVSGITFEVPETRHPW